MSTIGNTLIFILWAIMCLVSQKRQTRIAGGVITMVLSVISFIISSAGLDAMLDFDSVQDERMVQAACFLLCFSAFLAGVLSLTKGILLKDEKTKPIKPNRSVTVLCCVLCVLLIPIVALGARGCMVGQKIEPLAYSLSDDGTYYSVTGINGDYQGSEIMIPSNYQNLPVKSIGDSAFYCCTWLTSITIPDSVTSIGDWAFDSCTGLTSITISDSVTSIGNGAFYGCDDIETATIPAWAIDHLPKSNLKTVTITSGDSIGDRAFEYCDTLTSITIPDSVNYIGNYAFYGCEWLTSITIPDSVTSIGDGAFDGCYWIETATMPAWAIEYIPQNNLRTVVITSGDSIGYCAFEDCDTLTSITIPDSVNHIGDYAFYGCSNLTSITIPDSVIRIGYGAFRNCSGLMSIVFEDTSTWYRTTQSSYWWNRWNGTATNVTAPSTNATYFTSTYDGYYWYKA